MYQRFVNVMCDMTGDEKKVSVNEMVVQICLACLIAEIGFVPITYTK